MKNLFVTEVWPQLEPELVLEKKRGEVRLVGTGGTTSILARMENKLDRFDHEKIERTALPLAGRKEIPGLPRLRADVILTGILIYETVMAEIGFQQLHISTRSLRFAAVREQIVR